MSVPETAVEITNGHHAHYSSFDLETYIGRYAEGSETRLQRLAFIAQHSSDPALQHTAHQMLERQVKQAGNVIRYKQLYPEEQQQDADWIRTTTANNEAALEVLEARLSAAQANLNKDAIRIAYLNLGDHCVKVGLIRDALRHVLRARDYCTNRTQTGHICWNVIELAMNISSHNQVRDYVAKAEHAIVSGDHEFPRKLKVAAGMALLADGHYKDACQKLQQVKIPPENLSELASPEDVAMYSALLACATMNRTELVQYLEEQPTVLELVPNLREALRHYVRAEYKECLHILQSLGLELDLHVAAHADKLIELVRNRSYVDYLQPYRKVHLPYMASTFGQSPSSLEKSLAELIGKGEIRHARINCRAHTLEREETGEKAQITKTERRVQKLQETVLNDAYAAIVRLACVEHEPAEQRGASYGAGNPEDVLADVEDSDDDDDVDMVYDNVANPDDGE